MPWAVLPHSRGLAARSHLLVFTNSLTATELARRSLRHTHRMRSCTRARASCLQVAGCYDTDSTKKVSILLLRAGHVRGGRKHGSRSQTLRVQSVRPCCALPPDQPCGQGPHASHAMLFTAPCSSPSMASRSGTL